MGRPKVIEGRRWPPPFACCGQAGVGAGVGAAAGVRRYSHTLTIRTPDRVAKMKAAQPIRADQEHDPDQDAEPAEPLREHRVAEHEDRAREEEDRQRVLGRDEKPSEK